MSQPTRLSGGSKLSDETTLTQSKLCSETERGGPGISHQVASPYISLCLYLSVFSVSRSLSLSIAPYIYIYVNLSLSLCLFLCCASKNSPHCGVMCVSEASRDVLSGHVSVWSLYKSTVVRGQRSQRARNPPKSKVAKKVTRK